MATTEDLLVPIQEVISVERWRGKIDAFVESVPKQMDVLYKKQDVTDEKIDLLSQKVTSLVARMTLLAALGSFLGTGLTSIIVTVILKNVIR